MTARSGTAGPRHRLLLVVHFLDYAGMEQQCLHLARGLAGRGHQVTIACVVLDMAREEIEQEGIRVVVLKGEGRLAKLWRLGRLAWLARRHDAVHCTSWDASLWGRLAGVLARRPVVVTEHALDRSSQRSRGGAPRGRAIAWHHRLLAPLTHATIAVAERQLALLRQEGVPESRLMLIPNGVPVSAIRTQAEAPVDRADLGIPEEVPVVMQVGRFEPLKRQEWTLAAVDELRDRLGADVRAVFVGDGPSRSALEAGAPGWAHFLGIRSDVGSLLGLADLAVLPSSAEAMPLTMIEAMAAGLPQVTTDAGDMGVVLGRSGAGLVVPVHGEKAFRDACLRVLSEEGLWERLAAAARAGVEAFDVEVMTDRYASVLDSAIARRPAGDVDPVLA